MNIQLSSEDVVTFGIAYGSIEGLFCSDFCCNDFSDYKA